MGAFGLSIEQFLRYERDEPESVGFQLVRSRLLDRLDCGYELEDAGAATSCTYSVEAVPRLWLPVVVTRRIAAFVVRLGLLDLKREEEGTP